MSIKNTRLPSCAALVIVIGCFVIAQRTGNTADMHKRYDPATVYDAINEQTESLIDKDIVKRMQAFQFFWDHGTHARNSVLFQIDFRIDDLRKKDANLDQREINSPPKALAIVLQYESKSVAAIPYLLKNLEYQAEKGRVYPLGGQPDFKYPTYVCVPVLSHYGGALTEPTMHFLTRAPRDAVTDKQIEIIGYLLHNQYGSGQAAIRIVTVLAEEATKAPHAPNVVRLIDHLGNTYKP